MGELAAVAPAWLKVVAPPARYERYGRRVENYRLPKSEAARLALAAAIGADGEQLLAALDAATDRAEFQVDWEREVVTCPAGKRSISWLPNTWPENSMVWEARFARRDCTPCALRPRCTRAKREPRIIGLQAREHLEALQGARWYQGTAAFRASYAALAEIEGTHAQAIRRCGLRRCRCVGLAKTRLQHVITAAAVNLVRVAERSAGTPVAQTRCSRFAALQIAA